MILSRLPRAFILGVPLAAVAACGGDSLTLPPDGAAAHIAITAGNPQEGRVGEVLGTLLEVQVTDVQDRPVEGANVVFTFADGAAGGEASPDNVSTNADGRASTTLKLGTRAGTITGTAEVPVGQGVTPVRATFTLTALAANANGLTLVSGDPQTGVVNSTLPLPLVVQVTDINNNPIPNTRIEWAAVGGGSVSDASTLTGADGTTSVIRTLGPTAGPQSTTATAVGLAGSPITFTHTATPGGVNGLVKFSGDNQSALVGTELNDPLVVQVLDAAGNPISGLDVTWVVAEGAVSPVNTTTDSEGKASTRWTLGSTPGAKTANAVVSGIGTATFNATATAGSVSASNSSVSVSPATVTAGGSSTITVTVRDGSNNPVEGASVTVASTGEGNTITPASAPSGSNGVATFTFSSTVAEAKTIVATAGGVEISDRATITVQKTSSIVEITSDDPDPSTVGEVITVEFTVSGAGGTPSGDVVVTLSGGDERCQATLASDGTGSCSVTPTVAGTGTGNRRVITATYGGDARFSSDTDTDNHRVNPVPAASTTTTITSDTPDPSEAGAPVTVNFTVTSGSGTPSGDVQVTAEGGGSCTATVAQGSCQLTPGGTGTITLTATYGGNSAFSGSSDTEDHTVNAAPPPNQPPTAEFFPQPCSPDTRNCGFLDVSTDPEDGLPGTWSWNFGDPNTEADVSSERHPSYTYPAAGTYTVTLTVTDSDGATDTQTHDVIVP